MQGSRGFGLCPDTLESIAAEVAEVAHGGVRVGLVIGGGNIFRGQDLAARGLNRVTGDHVGMRATVINALAMQDALERQGLATRVQSAIDMYQVAEPLIRRRAVRHLEKGRVVIFAGGTGNPYFTTDTAAALRGTELKCDAIIKATKVDGVYDKDPARHPDAVKYKRISYSEAMARRLGIMDATAISLARETAVPIIVCSMSNGDIKRLLLGEEVGTIVQGD